MGRQIFPPSKVPLREILWPVGLAEVEIVTQEASTQNLAVEAEGLVTTALTTLDTMAAHLSSAQEAGVEAVGLQVAV